MDLPVLEFFFDSQKKDLGFLMLIQFSCKKSLFFAFQSTLHDGDPIMCIVLFKFVNETLTLFSRTQMDLLWFNFVFGFKFFQTSSFFFQTSLNF